MKATGYPKRVIINFYFPLILLMVLGAASCRNDISEINSTMAFFEPRKEWGQNIEMIYSEEGMVRIRLQAPHVNRLNIKDPYVEFPEGLAILFYDENLKVNSKLTAKYGIRYENRGQTIFRDSVKVI